MQKRNCTHRCLPTLLNAYGDQTVNVSSEMVGGAFQQWQQQLERQATLQTAIHILQV